MNSENSSPPSAAAGSSAPTLSATARDAVTQIKSTAQSTASDAKARFADAAGEKKTQAAGRIRDYSSALHDSAKSIEEKDPNLAWFAHRAADKLQSVADYVRERDFTDWRADAEGIARRHPAAFFGGLFFAGVVIGGVLRATASIAAEEATSSGSYDSDRPPTPDTLASGEPTLAAAGI